MTTRGAAPVGTPSRGAVPWQVKFGLLALIWGASFLFMRWSAPEFGTTFSIFLPLVEALVPAASSTVPALGQALT